ncbi:reverse transcriptase domain-containing protein [Tanacetum coccineum]
MFGRQGILEADWQELGEMHKEKLLSMDYRSRSRIQTNEKANSRATHINRTYGERRTYCIPCALAVAREAVSAVLITEREAKQMPIYFVSRALQDFIVERPEDDSLIAPMEVEEELSDPWTLFTDVSSCVDGSGAGLILTNPEGTEFTYALRFRFDATNNEAEYEALIAGLRIVQQIGIRPRESKKRLLAVSKVLNQASAKSENKKVDALNNPFKDWCETLSIRQRFASVKHPQANGLVERENRSLGEGMKARLDKGSKDWIEEISHVLWAHHTMIKSSNEDTMFSLTYALKLNLDLLEEKREQAAIREAKSKAKIEKYYNSKVHNTSFKPGDLVYRSNDASHAEDEGKLDPKWEGSYEVTEALGKGAYKLRDNNRKLIPRTWNVRNLKKCYIHDM